MRLQVLIHKAVSGYWAEVPSMPGCYTQAENKKELMVNIQEAIIGYLEVLATEERKVP